MTLQARDITVAIDGCEIVNSVSLDVAPGDCVGLIGPNGAGKSTLLRAMLGLRPRAGGGLTLDGEDIAVLRPRQRARRISYLPQTRQVDWALSARDVVALGRYPHAGHFGRPTPDCAGAIDAALGEVEAAALAGRPFSVLSGGEKARILLARALAVGAPYLLADEPIAGLDPYHQLHVMEILQARATAGQGVLVVMHDLALAARFMDRLVLMHGGEVISEGAPQSVLTPENLRKTYGISAISGEENGARWLVPWARAPRGV